MISFEIKSQLARLLATENITMMHAPGASTASFDVKTRTLRLPVWQNISEDLYDMLVVHEVGHALDTRLDDWVGAMDRIAAKYHTDKKVQSRAKRAIGGFLNVIEDARIDKRQKRRYPGSVRNYVNGYKELYERDFFKITGKNVNSLTFIDRLNLFFKHGAHLGIKFSKEEQAFVDRVANAETWADVEALTDEIYGYCKSRKDETPEMEQNLDFDLDLDDFEFSDDGDEEYYGEVDTGEDNSENEDVKGSKGLASKGDDDTGEKDDKESDGSGSDDKADKDDEKSSNGKSDEKKSKPEKKDEQNTNSSPTKGKKENEQPTEAAGRNKVPTQDEDFVPESETVKAAEEQAASIVSNSDVEYIYVDTPTPIYDKIVVDWKNVIVDATKQYERLKRLGSKEKVINSLSKWSNNEKDVVNFMVKEFETRKAADMYQRISIAKTGVIDTNKLHSYKFNDDIFRKHAVVPQGKNHGLVILVDWSGSMHSNLRDTLGQLFALVMFCKRVQVPFEVYTFRNNLYGEGSASQWNGKDIEFGGFKLRNFLSSRMNLTQLNQMMAYLWSSLYTVLPNDPLNSTPLQQAVLMFDECVESFKKTSKAQIVTTIILTDGDSDPASIRKFPQMGFTSHGKSHQFQYIIRDTKTKKSYVVPLNVMPNYHGLSFSLTSTFVKMLKERTKTTVIGFFLTSGNLSSVKHLIGADFIQRKDVQESWKNDKFVAATSAGYDEYYIMDVRGTSKKATLDITDKMSLNRVAKEFTKFSSKKKVNRVLMTRFIERIAKESV